MLLRGCIPSKALLHVAKILDETKHMSEWGIDYTPPAINIDTLAPAKTKLSAR